MHHFPDFTTTHFPLDDPEAVEAALWLGANKQLRLLGEWGLGGDFNDILQSAWCDWLESVAGGDIERLKQNVAATASTPEEIRLRTSRAVFSFLQQVGRYAAWNHVKRNRSFAPVSLDVGDLDIRDAETVRTAARTGRRLPRWMEEPLETAFLAQRAKKGKRGEEAARRDVRVIAFAIEGYSDDGIAMELGCTTQSAKSWRAQAKARLRRVVAQGGLDTPDFPIPASGHECARCHAPAHSWHHVVPQRAGGQDLETVPLCLECHSEAEGWYMRQERPGLTADDWRAIYNEWLTYSL